MTAASLDYISGLAVLLAAEARSISEQQTLAQHIRDRGEWTRIELGAENLRKEIAAMVDLSRSREPDLFEGAAE